jgi:hypothetical protein
VELRMRAFASPDEVVGRCSAMSGQPFEPRRLAFTADHRETVDAFHTAALETRGTTGQGVPGETYHSDY